MDGNTFIYMCKNQNIYLYRGEDGSPKGDIRRSSRS